MPRLRTSTPVACKVCNRMINRSSDMARHLDTHSPDKEKKKIPCTWPDCAFRTLQKSNMKIHMNRHRRLFPYKCLVPGCGFKSADPASLNRHETRRHGYLRRRTSGSGTPPDVLETTCRDRSTSAESTIPRSHPSSPHVCTNDHIEEGSRNMLPAYDSELVVKHAQSHDTLFDSTSGLDPVYFTSNFGVSAPEIPAIMHPHLLRFIPEQNDDHTFESTSQTIDDGIFGDCTMPFNNWLSQVGPPCNGPSHLAPHTFGSPNSTTSATLPAYSNVDDCSTPASLLPLSHAIDGLDVPTTSLLPSYEPKCSINNLFFPTPACWSLPGHEGQSTMTSSSCAYNGFDSSAAFFDDHFNFSQPNILATPDLGMGLYPPQPQATYPGIVVPVQLDYQKSSLYPATTDTGPNDGLTSVDFGMQELRQ